MSTTVAALTLGVDAERVEMTERAPCTEVECATRHNHLNDLLAGTVEDLQETTELSHLPIIGRRCRTCAVIRPTDSFRNDETFCLKCRRERSRRLRERWQVAARKPWVRRKGKTRCSRCYGFGHNVSTCDPVGLRPTPDLPTTPDFSANGFVYFIEARGTDRIKIGWATSVSRRLRSLQTASPMPLVLLGWMPGAVGLERRLHRQFATSRVAHGGEWFAATDELRAFIKMANATECHR